MKYKFSVGNLVEVGSTGQLGIITSRWTFNDLMSKKYNILTVGQRQGMASHKAVDEDELTLFVGELKFEEQMPQPEITVGDIVYYGVDSNGYSAWLIVTEVEGDLAAAVVLTSADLPKGEEMSANVHELELSSLSKFSEWTLAQSWAEAS